VGTDALHPADRLATAAVRSGVSAPAVAAARAPIAVAGYGRVSGHRTGLNGHGIGPNGHAEPDLLAGNPRSREPGTTFSVEPGSYLTGRHGAHIEDTVVRTTDGVTRLNTIPTELIVL
jgi:Xaa-Pro aminopeptidase